MRVGGCPVVVAQWQSTGGSTQRCPGFNFQRLLAFYLPLFSPHNINFFISSVMQDAKVYKIHKKFYGM